MIKISAEDIKVPLDVPPEFRDTYIQNYLKITHESGRLMMFAGDQKVEHLNDDFFGDEISPEDANPEHMFAIASKARIGVFATQIGLISRYGMDYKDIPYIVKLNAKTPLVKTEEMDPLSLEWINVKQVLEVKKNSGLNILGVGYTIYIGSENEAQMLTEVSQIIHEAHENGLLVVVWAYTRGKAVLDEKDPQIIAGATGVAAALGADFVKVNMPKKEGMSTAEALKQVVEAAGRTKVVCVGGSSIDAEVFLKALYDQIHIGGTAGNATGRNIHQRPLEEAVRFCNAIYAISVEDKTVAEAMQIYNGS